MVRCRAKSKRTGQPCQGFAVHGGVTCYHHGSGNKRRGADSPSARHARRHGLYANTLTPEQRAQFYDMFKAALDDPTISMIADAVFLRIKAAAAAEKAAQDPNGMVVVKQTATKQISPGADGEKRVVETAHIEKVDVTQPVSDLLVKAGRLAAEAAKLRREAGIEEAEDAALSEAEAAQVLAEEFGETGALSLDAPGEAPQLPPPAATDAAQPES
jgi:hypothetical protein